MSTNEIKSMIVSDLKLILKFKRTLLHFGWGILNLTLLTWLTTLIIGSGWEILWVVLVMSYMSMYWILAEKLSDALIGKELREQ